MNYNMPYNQGGSTNMMTPMFDPFMKVQQLEQEIFQLKGLVNSLERRVSSLENSKIIKTNSNQLNSNVSSGSEGLYMI